MGLMRLAVGGMVGTAALVALPLGMTLAVASQVGSPSGEAIADIPAAYLAIYQEAVAERCPALPWSVLAAVGKIESNHGRIGGGQLQPDGRVEPRIIGVALDGSGGTQRIADTDDGLHDGDVVYDRAVGPMQFIPSTWTTTGVDASGDGLADPHNAIDAIHASATYLCAAGASDPLGVRDALWTYNHSWDYVDAVLAQAARYSSSAIDHLPGDATLIAIVLSNPRIDIYEAGRVDIAEGRIDARILAVIQAASAEHTLYVSSLVSGHSRCVGGGDAADCRVSNHWYGRAADVSIVDNQAVISANMAARGVALWMATLIDNLRPDDVGTPWEDLAVIPGFFSDADHQDHLHLGFGD